ncbi:hypothetical protein [Affinirhizobium pseudoryzae]|jgi:hypothetical protein|uniref:hypothetical protein n=1 Tax=Allorhizobium pseudoryzae TaxID=379684 RepID=UPI0013E9DF3B|nr:hypothetical protein [Allorhizobium pseudoryzae]
MTRLAFLLEAWRPGRSGVPQRMTRRVHTKRFNGFRKLAVVLSTKDRKTVVFPKNIFSVSILSVD